MDEPIVKLCNTISIFCNDLETSCNDLKQSMERLPIPLDSASRTFLQSVNRRASVASADLNMLESMSFSTVSFEELLGHCNEVLKKNEIDIFSLQDSLGYIPPIDFDGEDEQDCGLDDFHVKNIGIEEDDPLLDDTLSLKNFGISDLSLANIASQDDSKFELNEPDFDLHLKSPEVIEGETRGDLNEYGDSRHLLDVSIDDYESLPKHMKSLVSWEDLLDAVGKMNSFIETKRIKPDTFQQNEIELLGLGSKIRSYLLLLIKMNRLCVEMDEGVICYRIL